MHEYNFECYNIKRILSIMFIATKWIEVFRLFVHEHKIILISQYICLFDPTKWKMIYITSNPIPTKPKSTFESNSHLLHIIEMVIRNYCCIFIADIQNNVALHFRFNAVTLHRCFVLSFSVVWFHVVRKMHLDNAHAFNLIIESKIVLKDMF